MSRYGLSPAPPFYLGLRTEPQFTEKLRGMVEHLGGSNVRLLIFAQVLMSGL